MTPGTSLITNGLNSHWPISIRTSARINYRYMPVPTTECAVCEIHAESTFRIDGMDCREEVAILERRLNHLPGLEDFFADLVGQRLRVRYDAAKLSTSAITEAIGQTGMRAWLEHEHPVGHAAATSREMLVVL